MDVVRWQPVLNTSWAQPQVQASLVRFVSAQERNERVMQMHGSSSCDSAATHGMWWLGGSSRQWQAVPAQRIQHVSPAVIASVQHSAPTLRSPMPAMGSHPRSAFCALRTAAAFWYTASGLGNRARHNESWGLRQRPKPGQSDAVVSSQGLLTPHAILCCWC